ncbi:MAG: hypothetical protein R2879_16855 [Saprospiraceae bacterium]
MKSIFFFLLFFSVFTGMAQEQSSLNSENHGCIYFGLMEDGALLSINLNYDIFSKGYWGYGVKAGFGINRDLGVTSSKMVKRSQTLLECTLADYSTL